MSKFLLILIAWGSVSLAQEEPIRGIYFADLQAQKTEILPSPFSFYDYIEIDLRIEELHKMQKTTVSIYKKNDVTHCGVHIWVERDARIGSIQMVADRDPPLCRFLYKIIPPLSVYEKVEDKCIKVLSGNGHLYLCKTLD